jgi:Arc/MetJ-type ribon-helix-helix transcriptional regulator
MKQARDHRPRKGCALEPGVRSTPPNATAPDRRGHVAHLRYSSLMKTAILPSVRVEPDFRAEVEAALAEGESLSEFVETSVRAQMERRRMQGEFIARGLRSRDEARRTGEYVDADAMITRLEDKLAAARDQLAKKRR